MSFVDMSLIENYKNEIIEGISKAVLGFTTIPDNDTISERTEAYPIDLPDGYSALADINVSGYSYTTYFGREFPPDSYTYIEFDVPLIEIYDEDGEIREAAKNVEWLQKQEC